MGYDEQFLKPEGRPGDKIAEWAAYVSLVATWGITISSNNSKSQGLFFFHPTLQSLAIAIFTYGILTLQPTSQARTKAAGLTRHQLAMLALGFPAMALGTFAIVWRKYVNDAPHFISWHGTIGIISVAWLVLQIVLGGGSVWFGGRLFGGTPKAKLVWKYHRLSGYILFPLLLLVTHLGGAWSNWSNNASGFFVRLLAFTISPIVLLAAVLVRVR
ncbi:hypothetical protein BD309DRAFT_848523 [Dichomitus squalens]|uniref:uncharacterized protein n=1 Tax=Dichomitus squalens (strain LYAD-421) TaxID=732165 RepID=UPI0004414165|nr:uncharacterized protein DICSQDRAFT_48632 [Dichomitus squalens LYAD-421 SS1]EJF65714.1 hypothetical protein DICSQDRAFT_48632 [Dichomitus squalens LYAD-421 SS1]TBU50607.1 hypothetical protein BD309DRAFT_848523 [Dichomitus squalens]